jgi:hypothetical protein
MNAADPFADWDAAYVLGALSPVERRQFELHKATCGACAASVESLAGMPALLASVPRREVELLDDADPAAELGSSVPAAVLTSMLDAHRHRRLRRRVASSVLIAAAVVGVSLAVTLPRSHEHKASEIALTQVVKSPLHANVSFVSESWGTQIDIHCTYDGESAGSNLDSRAYALVVTDRAGNQVPAGSWRASSGQTSWPTGSVSIPLADISKVQVRSASGVPLLQLTR